VTSVPWDSIYRGSDEDPFERRRGILGLVGNTELWLNFLLLFVALTAMTNSLEHANWVDEMPSLTAAAVFGLTSGWLLAQIPVRSWWLQIAGVGLGLGWVFALAMANMELADPLLGTGVRARWSEAWLRLREWGSALLDGGISSDPLPFVLMLVFATWAVAYLGAWAVVRWRNPWVALIPPGFVLLTNISYLPGQPSLQFVVFLFAAVLLVLQLHFAKALHRWRANRIAWPDLMSIEVAFAGAWIALGLIVVAWLVPTANNWGPVANTWNRAVSPVTDRFEGLGRVFIGVPSKRDIPVHSFGEVLPLQGNVSLSSTPIMEVTSDELGNLRGAVYDEYTGTGWLISDISTRPLLGTTVEAAAFGTPLSQAQLRRPVTAQVSVIGDVPDRRLLSLGDPIAADVPAGLIVGANVGDIVGIAPDDRLKEGTVYTVVGAVSAATVDTLASSRTDYPTAIRERYTQLPDDLPPEVGELAASVAGGLDPFSASRAIEQYLRTNYAYSTDVADPPPLRDAVDHFLFDSQAGYFDHHATSMAVMLRTLGIPTRMAAGFVLDEDSFDDVTRTYVLSEKDAWAWPEVYFAGLGWVEFNPTPGRALVTRAGDDSALQALSGGGALTLSTLDEELLLAELEALFEAEGAAALDTISANDLDTGSGVGAIVVQMLTFLLIGGAIVVGAIVSLKIAWEYPLRALSIDQRHWAKIQRLVSWTGIRPHATRTPLEWAREVADEVGESTEFDAIARDYTRIRYGAELGERSEEQLTALNESYRVVRNRLWRRAFGRVIPRRGASPVAEATATGTDRV
jgi:transglutaminase-like putative cysteine protease